MLTFVRLQLFWLVASLVVPTVCLILALTGAADPLVLSNIALPTILGCWIVGLVTPFAFGGNASRESRRTGFVLMWSAIAILFPLSWDLPWAILHDWVYGATSQDTSKWYFWAYAVADTRFLRSEPLMIIVEYWSGIIGLVEIAFLSLFLRNQLKRAVRCFIAATSFQYYGTSVFFISELMRGLADIRPDAVSYLKFFGLNGMWLVVPAISGFMLVQLLTDPEYDATAAVRRMREKPLAATVAV